MASGTVPLASVYEGWDGYQTSIVHAIAPLTREQLVWRPAPNHRSVGELARHIALGRVDWFLRMQAPGSAEIAAKIPAWEHDPHGNAYAIENSLPIAEDAAVLVGWLEDSWGMLGATLAAWTVADLAQTYRHTWRGDVYAVSRQWTIWRIMAHDIHHGGELALMLGMQGIEIFELGDLGGHIIMPTMIEPARP